MRRAVERASAMPFHNASRPTPNGVTAPIPVTTTRSSGARMIELLQGMDVEALEGRAIEPCPVEAAVAVEMLPGEEALERRQDHPDRAGRAALRLLPGLALEHRAVLAQLVHTHHQPHRSRRTHRPREPGADDVSRKRLAPESAAGLEQDGAGLGEALEQDRGRQHGAAGEMAAEEVVEPRELEQGLDGSVAGERENAIHVEQTHGASLRAGPGQVTHH